MEGHLEAFGDDWLYLVIGFGVGFALAILVYFTSESEKPPKYCFMFSIVGLVNSLIWLNFVAESLITLILVNLEFI